MKVLMVTPYPPYPPDSGTRIRQWEQIGYLGQRHDLTVVSFTHSQEEYELRGMLDGRCSRSIMVQHPTDIPPVERADWKRLPWPVRWYCTREMQQTIEELRSAAFDLVLVENLYMAQYHPWFTGLAVLQEYNIESALFKQYAQAPEMSRRELHGRWESRAFLKATWMHMVEHENRTWPRFPLRTTVSADDKREMERRCPSGRTIVIENGVNTDTVGLVTYGESCTILFMGTMNYAPNIDAACYLVDCIMPLIWRKDGTVRVWIAGRNPPQCIRELASEPRIEVIANPKDMRAIAQGCRLTVAPLRAGGGTRIKILESMAMGLPVVSTSLGCEGLAVRDGEHILIRDAPEQFADAVLEVISDPVLANSLRASGRRLVEERYDWRPIFARLEMGMVSLVDGARCL